MSHSPTTKINFSLKQFTLFLILNLSCINAQGEPPSPDVEKTNDTINISTTKSFVSEKKLQLSIPLSKKLIDFWVNKEMDEALSELRKMNTENFSKQQQDAFATTQAWLALHSSMPELAISSLQTIQKSTDFPEDYRSFLLGGIFLGQEKHEQAIQEWEKILSSSPLYHKAQWKLSSIHKESDQEAYYAGLKTLSLQEFPISNGEQILWELAKKEGFTTKTGYPYLRKIWAHYPYGSHKKAVKGYLSEFKKIPDYQPTAAEWNIRAKKMMVAWQFKTLIAELSPKIASFPPTSKENCQLIFAYGRSHFKINSVTKASQLLKPAAEKCIGINDNAGAKSYYLIGKSYERKKMWAEAAKAFEKIPQSYPAHSMADDGYALAGIGWQESGNKVKALASWTKQVKKFPDGDLIGEGYWRLAWSSFQKGETATALEWAVEAQGVVPPENQMYHYFAFPYWEARWRIYPSWDNPSQENEDRAEVEKGIQQLKDLVTNHPTDFYALLASARLYELDRPWMEAQKRSRAKKENGWHLDEPLASDPIVQRASQLISLGLLIPADEELHRIETSSITQKAIHNWVHREINWFIAHDELHKYSQQHPPHTWTENQGQFFAQIYPNSHWETLQEVGKDHQYDLRIFHSLVREESSFNPQIVSWAGAKGLSQLMPPTADRVASWLNISVNSKNIFDPKINLSIGSRYLDYLRGYFNGNMFLAVAGYNAGEGNVGKWLKSKGNLPTDAFIESIPFRETRHYVKRVFGTYQAYHYQQDDEIPFYDFSAFNHQAKP